MELGQALRNARHILKSTAEYVLLGIHTVFANGYTIILTNVVDREPPCITILYPAFEEFSSPYQNPDPVLSIETYFCN